MTKERRFTYALMEVLDYERDRREMDQITFAAFMGVTGGLLSLYRSGQRIPSITGMFRMEQAIPDLFSRTMRVYDRLQRDADRQRETSQPEEELVHDE